MHFAAIPPAGDRLSGAMVPVDSKLQSLSDVLQRAEARLTGRADPESRVWPTGFDPLDHHLTGGFRAGELVLLAGPQGLGKTTWALQAGRNLARSGRQVAYFCFEHDPQSLLERLVALEAGEVGGYDAPDLRHIRVAFEAQDRRSVDLAHRLDDHKGGAEAVERVRAYSERYHLHRSSGRSTSVEVITDVVEGIRESTGAAPLVVVDYLQKLHVPGGSMIEDERITVAVEGLKDLALDHHVPVLAIAAGDKEGIASGRRMRSSHLRGSSALAYEADTLLILNNKFDVVARHHLVYDLASAEKFRAWAVLTIEKNRSGLDKIDMEFRTRFDHGRFEQDGGLVKEQLIDERVFTE
jgi:replicative DNA helicase